MLVNSGVRVGGGPARYSGAALAHSVNRATWSTAGALRNFSAGEATLNGAAAKSGLPNGSLHPASWMLPTRAGSLASFATANGAGNVTAGTLAGGINGLASLTGAGNVTSAQANLLLYAIASLAGSGGLTAAVVGRLDAAASLAGSGNVAGSLSALLSAVASLTGSGNVNAATLIAVVSAVASLTGSGVISTANASLLANLASALAGSGALNSGIIGALNAAADLAGAGNITASIRAIGFLLSGLSGSGSVTATPYGPASMSANLRAFGDLTPEGLSAAVWGALAASTNSAGTMGELLNNSGAGANPWTVTLEGSYTAADLLRLVASALAGNATVPPGAGAFAFRDLADTKDRIVGAVDIAGDRAVTGRDGS